ncbi:hypothetical protein Lw1_gp133 [Escherichia phage Lw1]|uniref:Uncharacterized protein n=1 Tax=Escherichia phage Lw1 TaxID=1307804 RepID=M9UXS9_9CAUD|nr:hypothetical protein Lw1_gp133 [Escherichia phage Lw1]AGJ71541.1 hypothetical protein Lw1_gp133 [Escherichia phage Lw1]
MTTIRLSLRLLDFKMKILTMTPIEKICCPRHGGSGDKFSCPFCR